MKNILCILLLSAAGSVSAQILNQDASGKSAIVWNGSSINIDATEALIKVNHYRSVRQSDTKEMLWGIDLQAKNQNGFAPLFSSGELNSKSELSGLLGFGETTFGNRVDLSADIKKLEELRNTIETKYDGWVSTTIAGCKIPTTTTNDALTVLVLDEVDAIKYKGWKNADESIMKILLKFPATPSCPSLINELKSLAAKVKNDSDVANYVALDEKIASRQEGEESHIPNSTFRGYIRGGLTATEFKYDRGKLQPTFAKRFTDTLRVGYFFELGFTYQRDMSFFGLCARLAKTNNFGSLDDQEYTFSQDTVLGNGKLSSKETFTAYTGNYETYTSFEFDIDYQRMIDLEESHYLLIGPYLRPRVPVGADFAKSSTALGLSLNYINGKSGKFLGGVYVQSDDLFGSLTGEFREKFRFGVNSRFTLSSIFKR